MLYKDLLTQEELNALLSDSPAPQADWPAPGHPLAEQIKSIRTMKGLSLQQAATAAGLPGELLARIEADLEVPTLGDLLRLAGAFELPLDLLVFGENSPFPNPPIPVIPNETMGDRLIRIRQSKRLSRDRAAVDLGISYTSLTAFEKGYREPDLLQLRSFSRYYQVPAHFLAAGLLSPSLDPGTTAAGEADSIDLRLLLLEPTVRYNGALLSDAMKQHIMALLEGSISRA